MPLVPSLVVRPTRQDVENFQQIVDDAVADAAACDAARIAADAAITATSGLVSAAAATVTALEATFSGRAVMILSGTTDEPLDISKVTFDNVEFIETGYSVPTPGVFQWVAAAAGERHLIVATTEVSSSGLLGDVVFSILGSDASEHRFDGSTVTTLPPFTVSGIHTSIAPGTQTTWFNILETATDFKCLAGRRIAIIKLD